MCTCPILFVLSFREESFVLKEMGPISCNPISPKSKVTDYPLLHPKPRGKMSKRVFLRNIA